MAAQSSSSDSAELSMEISSGSVIEGMVGRPGASSASGSSSSGVTGVKKRAVRVHYFFLKGWGMQLAFQGLGVRV